MLEYKMLEPNLVVVPIVIIIAFAVRIAMALIPAYVAKHKGYSFGLWLVYGFVLFYVAIIHVILIPNKSEVREVEEKNFLTPGKSVDEEIKRNMKLLEGGVITEKEFLEKKNKLLREEY